MSLAQENFDRATRTARPTIEKLGGRMMMDLGATNRRELLGMLHDLEQIGAAIRLELMDRER